VGQFQTGKAVPNLLVLGDFTHDLSLSFTTHSVLTVGDCWNVDLLVINSFLFTMTDQNSIHVAADTPSIHRLKLGEEPEQQCWFYNNKDTLTVNPIIWMIYAFFITFAVLLMHFVIVAGRRRPLCMLGHGGWFTALLVGMSYSSVGFSDREGADLQRAFLLAFIHLEKGSERAEAPACCLLLFTRTHSC